MTYVKLLELLASSNNIEAWWKFSIKENDRKVAAENIKEFIIKNGHMVGYYRRDYTNILQRPKPIVLYYKFPTMGSKILKKEENLIKLYKFFFEPKQVIRIYSYD